MADHELMTDKWHLPNKGGMGVLYEQAIMDYSQAIRLAPALADVYKRRGNAYQALGRQAEAGADFQKYCGVIIA